MASYTDGAIAVYSLESCERVALCEGNEDSLVQTNPPMSNMVIDDLCSHYGYVCPDRKSIQIGLINWDYAVLAIKKPSLDQNLAKSENQLRRWKKEAENKIVNKLEKTEPEKIGFVERMRRALSPCRVADDSEESSTCLIF